MEKIFDLSVVSYLKETGVTQKEIDKIKFKKLKELSLAKLELIASLIKNDEYDKLKKFFAWSGSGDGYGSENHYINFGDIIGSNTLDIEELTKMLNSYKTEIGE